MTPMGRGLFLYLIGWVVDEPDIPEPPPPSTSQQRVGAALAEARKVLAKEGIY